VVADGDVGCRPTDGRLTQYATNAPPRGGGGACHDAPMFWLQTLRIVTICKALAYGPVTFWHGIPQITTFFPALA
jgi:hypothetical protein